MNWRLLYEVLVEGPGIYITLVTLGAAAIVIVLLAEVIAGGQAF